MNLLRLKIRAYILSPTKTTAKMKNRRVSAKKMVEILVVSPVTGGASRSTRGMLIDQKLKAGDGRDFNQSNSGIKSATHLYLCQLASRDDTVSLRERTRKGKEKKGFPRAQMKPRSRRSYFVTTLPFGSNLFMHTLVLTSLMKHWDLFNLVIRTVVAT